MIRKSRIDFSFEMLGKEFKSWSLRVVFYYKIKRLRGQSLLPRDKTKQHRVTALLKG